ncbi:MAG TPA: hypothetical protein VEH82_06715 [Acidimicrobiales bacterium]|nr:hypothetical protein [Acidimicrobiales bacterium]
MKLSRKVLLGAVGLALPIGSVVAVAAAASGGAASAAKPVPVVVGCTGLTGSLDFTNASTQPGLTGQGETYTVAGAVGKANTSSVAISTSPLTNTNCSYTSGGSGGVNVGAVNLPPIVTKAAKAYAIEQCSGFSTATKSLKGLTVTLGNWTFKTKSGSALYFTNPSTTMDPGGGGEVGFLLSGQASNPTIGPAASDKSASITAWLDPLFSGKIVSCIGSPGTYVGAITSANIDNGDSNASF